jgi:hypothetical protein
MALFLCASVALPQLFHHDVATVASYLFHLALIRVCQQAEIWRHQLSAYLLVVLNGKQCQIAWMGDALTIT